MGLPRYSLWKNETPFWTYTDQAAKSVFGMLDDRLEPRVFFVGVEQIGSQRSLRWSGVVPEGCGYGPEAFSSLQLTLPDIRVMLPTGTDVLFGAAQGDDKGNQRKNPDHNQQDGEGQPATWRLLFIKIAAEVTVSKRRILIQLSRSWPYPKYPPQPIVRCGGYQRKDKNEDELKQ